MPIFAVTALFVLILDQITKVLVRGHIRYGGQVPLLPGWVHLVFVNNQGAAWSVLTGQRVFLVVFTTIVTVVVGYMAREMVARGKLAATGWGLIMGGALGNLADRASYGKVTDFIQLDTTINFIRTFPVFNVADSALTVGVVLMVLSLLLAPRPAQTSDTPAT